MRGQQYQNAGLAALHKDLIAWTDLERQAIEYYADYMRTGDETASIRATEAHEQALGREGAWLTALTAQQD